MRLAVPRSPSREGMRLSTGTTGRVSDDATAHSGSPLTATFIVPFERVRASPAKKGKNGVCFFSRWHLVYTGGTLESHWTAPGDVLHSCVENPVAPPCRLFNSSQLSLIHPAA